MDYSVPISSSATVGDLCVVAILGPSITPPTGWSSLASGSIGGFSYGVWDHTLVAGDLGTTVLFNFTAGVLTAALFLDITGTSGFDGNSFNTSSTGVTSLATSATNIHQANDLLVCLWLAGAENQTITMDSALTPVIRQAGVNVGAPSVSIGSINLTASHGKTTAYSANWQSAAPAFSIQALFSPSVVGVPPTIFIAAATTQ